MLKKEKPKKRKREKEKNIIDEHSGEIESSSEINEIVNVNFDFFPPVPADIDDISSILSGYLDSHIFHTVDFSSLVVSLSNEGKGVGDVVCADGEDDVLGVASCVCLNNNSSCTDNKNYNNNNVGVKDVVDYLMFLVNNNVKSDNNFLCLVNSLTNVSSSSLASNISINIDSNICSYFLLFFERFVNMVSFFFFFINLKKI
jgi:hypothetical protein